MTLRTTILAAAVGAAALTVTTSTPAQAADAHVWSTTGESYAWYDDSTGRVSFCDMVAHDGDGATGTVQLPGGETRNRTVFNGCETVTGVPDGVQMRITVCDWMWSWNGYRNPYNCSSVWLNS